MCNSVIARGREYESPRELASLVGGQDKLVWQDRNPFVNWPEGKDWHQLDECLCPIDLQKTLDAAGLAWRRGADPMQYIVE